MLLAVDSVGKTYDFACTNCGTTLRGEPVAQLLQSDGSLMQTCGVCHTLEGFCTALTVDDANGTSDDFRATQATLIRAVQAAL